MEANDICPWNLESPMRTKYQLIEPALILNQLGFTSEETLYRQISELIFGERTQALSDRDIEVIGFSIINEYYAMINTPGNLVLPSFLPTYESFPKPDSINPNSKNTHLLLGCITPYSAHGHRLLTLRRYGETSLNLTMDVESPYMVDIDKSAVQASAMAIPLSDSSLRSVLTHNLFAYIDDEDILDAISEIRRVLEPNGEYLGIESASLKGLFVKHFPCSEFKVEIIPAFMSRDRDEEKRYVAYPTILPSVSEVPGLLAYRFMKRNPY